MSSHSVIARIKLCFSTWSQQECCITRNLACVQASTESHGTASVSANGLDCSWLQCGVIQAEGHVMCRHTLRHQQCQPPLPAATCEKIFAGDYDAMRNIFSAYLRCRMSRLATCELVEWLCPQTSREGAFCLQSNHWTQSCCWDHSLLVAEPCGQLPHDFFIVIQHLCRPNIDLRP